MEYFFADELKAFKKLAAACNNQFRQLTQPYMHLYPAVTYLKPASSTHGDAYPETPPGKSQS